MGKVVVRFGFNPRPYQRRALEIMQKKRRGVFVWHRRAGKDLTFFNFMVFEALTKSRNYYYYLPTSVQGRKIIWEGKDSNGKPFLDYCPKQVIKARHENEMKLTFHNGSIIQVLGTNDPNSVVGPNPYGCVFSEFALQNPDAWRLTMPILRENGGWAIFIFTPRGKNHAYKLFKMAQEQTDEWYAEVLTVNDTKREDGSPVFSPQDIDAERKQGMSEQLIQQEYYCSFEGQIEGAFYASELAKARAEGRITRVPWEPKLPVYTAWDLGVSNDTAIWFFQQIGGEVRFIDFYQSRGEGLGHYIKILRSKPYVYERHYAPHDLNVREFGTGKTRLETARSLGVYFSIARRIERADGIEAVRILLAKSWFDERKCEEGISALNAYRREYNEATDSYSPNPVEDWTNHAADAMRVAAISIRELSSKASNTRPIVIANFDPWRDNPEERPKIISSFNVFTGEPL